MKIAVLGYAGSGKSTLARALGDYYGLPVLHLDTVMFLPGWRERPQEEQLALVRDFMDRHEGWVIDGNYSNLLQPRRLAEADLVVMLLFGRLSSLARVTKRYRRFRGQSRPDMAPQNRLKKAHSSMSPPYFSAAPMFPAVTPLSMSEALMKGINMSMNTSPSSRIGPRMAYFLY